jgi:hypothetical protein
MVPVNKFFPKYHDVLINNLVLFFIRRLFNLRNLRILRHFYAPPMIIHLLCMPADGVKYQ